MLGIDQQRLLIGEKGKVWVRRGEFCTWETSYGKPTRMVVSNLSNSSRITITISGVPNGFTLIKQGERTYHDVGAPFEIEPNDPHQNLVLMGVFKGGKVVVNNISSHKKATCQVAVEVGAA